MSANSKRTSYELEDQNCGPRKQTPVLRRAQTTFRGLIPTPLEWVEVEVNCYKFGYGLELRAHSCSVRLGAQRTSTSAHARLRVFSVTHLCQTRFL